MKKKVLILNGQYLPGYKGGGPIQSCVNLVENLNHQFDFYVLTADRDYKEDIRYQNIKINEWNQVGAAKVFYMSPDKQTIYGFKKILNDIEFDILYLNGFFSPIFTIKPLFIKLIGQLKKSNVILTPRGDFSGGIENKKLKKYIYIYFSKLIGLYRGLSWHATSLLEEKNIKELFKNADIFVVPNLPAKYVPKSPILEKRSGELRLIFISRIFPKKNLKYALEVLSKVKSGKVLFDIYGPMEDIEYWDKCNTVIKKMPSNIQVTYKGELPHSKIANVFEQYHAFFFPTLGENYGHVIVEAMMNNCLVILSKGVTPWDDYEKNGGYIESLSNQNGFVNIINNFVTMNNKHFEVLLDKNRAYVTKKINSEEDLKKYTRNF
jgi:glycosyltransferase involved in cell wall biosynthesis